MKSILIQPRSPFRPFSLREFVEFRDLFFTLTMRDIRLRYKQTVLGIAWVILQPLLTAFLFAVIFGRVVQLPCDGVPYILFAFAGMLPWLVFSQSLQRGGSSLVSDAQLITKVYFPRILIPLASCFAVLIDFGVALLALFVMLLFYGHPITLHWLFLPYCLLIAFVFSVGVVLFFSALNVYYRDFKYILPFLIQLWMYASPVAYSSALIPESWQSFYALNPLVGIIDGFRWSLFSSPSFPLMGVAIATLISLCAFVGGLLTFKKIERHFTDVI